MPKRRVTRPPRRTASPRGTRTLISFVLDKSGSMSAIANATISGFNEFKAAQAALPGTVRFTLTLFDTTVQRVCTAVPIREVPDLTRETYRPGSCTALYDAVGSTILAVDRYLAEGHAVDQVVFVVMTDGLENASREFTHRQVFDMIAERQAARGYEFVYLGANQDSYEESARIGVRAGRNLDFAANEESVHACYEQLSNAMGTYRSAQAPQMDEWFAKPE